MQKTINANIEKMVAVIDEQAWCVDFNENFPNEAYISQSSPLGDDFGFVVSIEDEHEFKDGIIDNYMDFDPEEHAAMLWNNRDTIGGVPNSLTLLLEDANAIKSSLSALVDAINEVMFE